MDKQKKQNLLTAIIIILVIALIMMLGSIIYEEKINMSKQPIKDTSAPVQNEEEKDNIEDKDGMPLEDENSKDTDTTEEPKEQPEEYVGEEENNSQKETTQSNDEKAINLVKKEWGNDDTVTFSIEKKDGTKYRIAVRNSSTTVLQWYEVDTETWQVSEY